MFKKTLVALALAGMSNAAFAVAINDSAETLSVEGLAAGVITGNIVTGVTTSTITLGAEYTVGDTITFTLAGGEFKDDTLALTINAAGAHETITWGLLTKTATTAVFRVTAITTGADGKTAGATYDLDGDVAADLDIKVASIANGGKVTLTTDARTSTGIAIDIASGTGANEGVLLTGKSQLTLATTAMAAKVDVSEGRKAFVDNTTAFFEIDLDTAAATYGAITYTATDYVIKGDFTGVKDVVELGADAAGTAIGGAAGTDADNTKLTIATDKKSAKLTVAGAPAAAPLKFAFDLPTVAADKVALVAQTFTADVIAKYNVTVNQATDKSVGSWSLNGATAQVPFMPFSAEYAQSITVANTGSVDGEITVDFYADGKMNTKALTAKAASKSITNISAEVKAAAAEFGITTNARINIIVNSPEADIKVNAIYYHIADADRVKVN